MANLFYFRIKWVECYGKRMKLLAKSEKAMEIFKNIEILLGAS